MSSLDEIRQFTLNLLRRTRPHLNEDQMKIVAEDLISNAAFNNMSHNKEHTEIPSRRKSLSQLGNKEASKNNPPSQFLANTYALKHNKNSKVLIEKHLHMRNRHSDVGINHNKKRLERQETTIQKSANILSKVSPSKSTRVVIKKIENFSSYNELNIFESSFAEKNVEVILFCKKETTCTKNVTYK